MDEQNRCYEFYFNPFTGFNKFKASVMGRNFLYENKMKYFEIFITCYVISIVVQDNVSNYVENIHMLTIA